MRWIGGALALSLLAVSTSAYSQADAELEAHINALGRQAMPLIAKGETQRAYGLLQDAMSASYGPVSSEVRARAFLRMAILWSRLEGLEGHVDGNLSVAVCQHRKIELPRRWRTPLLAAAMARARERAAKGGCRPHEFICDLCPAASPSSPPGEILHTPPVQHPRNAPLAIFAQFQPMQPGTHVRMVVEYLETAPEPREYPTDPLAPEAPKARERRIEMQALRDGYTAEIPTDALAPDARSFRYVVMAENPRTGQAIASMPAEVDLTNPVPKASGGPD